jgi:LSD1 subclass zinc finger protein
MDRQRILGLSRRRVPRRVGVSKRLALQAHICDTYVIECEGNHYAARHSAVAGAITDDTIFHFKRLVRKAPPTTSAITTLRHAPDHRTRQLLQYISGSKRIECIGIKTETAVQQSRSNAGDLEANVGQTRTRATLSATPDGTNIKMTGKKPPRPHPSRTDGTEGPAARVACGVGQRRRVSSMTNQFRQ